MDDVSVTGSPATGILAEFRDGTTVTGSDLSVTDSALDGIHLTASDSNVTLSGIRSTGSGEDGIDVTATAGADVALADASVSGSAGTGIEASAENADAAIAITGATSTGNGEHGLWADSEGTGGRVDIADSAFVGNSLTAPGCGVWIGDASGTGVEASLSRSTIADNLDAIGGLCVLYDGSLNGAVTVADSTFSGNETFMAPLFANLPLGSTLDVVGVTISGNTSVNAGGLLAGGLIASGEVTVRSTTIADNEAGGASVLLAGLETAAISNTIIAGHPGTDLYLDSMNALTIDYTLIETIDPAVPEFDAGTGNLTGFDPALLPLADNGGSTLTRLPETGSPVVNAGDPAFAAPPTLDQRGLDRVREGRIDLGAVETQEAMLAATGIETPPALALAGLVLLAGLALVVRTRRTSD